ncbi:MAG: TetR/AcrR family transcriptional regulator [Gammaproteobacteria bacterium]|nr:TetR/AcrR family transcriptional regulator [Gammaproteobacteria bacterium]
MAGPNKQFDKHEVLKKALDVFWIKGFEATSIQDLVDEMGINRASLYQTYGNKHALFTAAIDQYMESSLVQMKQTLEAPGSPLHNLRQSFEYIVDYSLEGLLNGCFINNAAIELGPHDPDIANKVRGFWRQFEALFEKTLIRAIENKELSQNINTEKLATFINSTLQGLIIKTKVSVPKDELINDIDLLFSLISKAG